MSSSMALFLNPLAGSQKALARFRSKKFQQVNETAPVIFDHAITDVIQRQRAVDLWIQDCQRKGMNRFAAGGGDGTVHELLNGIMRTARDQNFAPQTMRFGAVGLGSSCDFLKIDRKKRLTRIDFERAESSQIGAVSLDGKPDIYFMINASIGLTTEANALFNRRPRWLQILARLHTDLAIVGAALWTLVTFQSRALRLQCHGVAATQKLTNLGITRQKSFAGSFSYDRTPMHGLFSIYSCIDLTRMEILKTMISLLRGRFPRSSKHEYTEAAAIEISDSHPFTIELDGEIFTAMHAKISLVEGPLVCPLT